MLELILGPMYSGKTTLLLEHMTEKTLLLNHKLDTRTDGVSTHDGLKVPAHKCDILPVVCGFDTVLIDEAQFFSSLDGVEDLAKTVVVAGLSGDYMRRPFGKILDLIPKADKVTFLTARCSYGRPAPLKRVSPTTDLVERALQSISCFGRVL